MSWEKASAARECGQTWERGVARAQVSLIIYTLTQREMLLRVGLLLAYNGGAPRPLQVHNAPPLARACALVMSDRGGGEVQASGDDPSNSRNFNWGGDKAESEALRLPTGVKAAERLTAPVEPPRAKWFERQGPSSDPVEMRRRIDEDTKKLSSEWTRLWAVCVVIALAIVAADLPSGS